MSLKSIELQIAIPKTVDAGKLADQKQQRIQVMQDHANLQTEKQAEKDKETVLETEHYKAINGDDDTEQGMHQQHGRKKTEEQQEKEKESKHPYKGSFVDFSG